MSGPETVDPGAEAREGFEVQAILEMPGWKVIETALDDYMDGHLRYLLGKQSGDDRTVQFQLGRIRAIKQDLPAILKDIVDRGRKAELARTQEESNG